MAQLQDTDPPVCLRRPPFASTIPPSDRQEGGPTSHTEDIRCARRKEEPSHPRYDYYETNNKSASAAQDQGRTGEETKPREQWIRTQGDSSLHLLLVLDGNHGQDCARLQQEVGGVPEGNR